MEQKKDNKKLYILMLVIALLIGTNVYLYIKKNKTEVKLVTVTDERTNLQSDLATLEIELADATNSTNKLSTELQAKDAELKAKLNELKTALQRGNLTANELEKARTEMDQLRYYVKKYQGEIEALKQENAKLSNENSGLKESVDQERKKASGLENENINLSNKVAVAQMLKVATINATAVKTRSSGSEVETTRAKSTEKVKVSFSVIENAIAPQGPRDIYLRVVNPTGKVEVVTDNTESKFMGDGQELQYSAKTSINYKNTKSDVFSIYWVKGSLYEKGVYKATLYSDGASMGSTVFELK